MSFEIFWFSYPIKRDKKAARNAYEKALLITTHEQIISAIENYKSWLNEKDDKTWRPEPKYPASWLNGECWDDEYETLKQSFSPEESRRKARLKGFYERGLWNDEWGPRPQSNVVKMERTA